MGKPHAQADAKEFMMDVFTRVTYKTVVDRGGGEATIGGVIGVVAEFVVRVPSTSGSGAVGDDVAGDLPIAVRIETLLE